MSDEWNESLGAAIESAALALPNGYKLWLDIERYGCAAKLVLPDATIADVSEGSLVDEIESLVELAIRHSEKSKPRIKEDLHFQPWND